jgi:hypothetical protein
MFRTVRLSIFRSSFTVHSAMVYVIQVCRQLTSRIRKESHPSPARKLSTNLYDIYHRSVYSEWIPDDGQTHCPKHVAFHVKNKICEISASTWFYYKEICYDARSHDRKIRYRPFGTTYRSHLQGSSWLSFYLDFLTLEGWDDRLSRNVGKKLPIYAV